MDSWEVLDLGANGSEVLAIHAALLPDGHVTYFSGSQHDAAKHNAGQIDNSRVWDPVANVTATIPSPDHDLFCCGHGLIGDGRLMVAGGSKTYDYLGVRQAQAFNASALPDGDPWEPAPDMNGGRWYPTLVTLADGRVLAVAGALDRFGTGLPNLDVEVFDPSTGDWAVLGTQPDIPGGYPRMHVIPDGRVLCVTPMAGVCRTWNPITLEWGDFAPGPGFMWAGYNTTCVLLPLLPEENYRARVLLSGLDQPGVLDTSDPGKGWEATPPRVLDGWPVRNHGCSVLLPDATVAIVGGSTSDADEDGVLAPEIWNPVTGEWFVGSPASVPRVYHSVALLLPDGRVWTAGSNHDGAQGSSELRVELYSPPYLFKGPRPIVTDAPAAIGVPTGLPVQTRFEIFTPDAGSIASVALLRCGSVTHSFDSDQRYVGLAIVDRGADVLVVTTPPTAEIAPPGPYFLYVVNLEGAVSIGRPLRVQSVTWTPPRAVPGWFGELTAEGDVAVADVSGSGRPDLVVFHIDTPGGGNGGYYRIGRDVDPDGVVTGGWTDPMPVPGWFGEVSAGGGVAVADISGSGRPDIVVMHIDVPGGGNGGYYRVGWDLDGDGNATGGWTAVKGVPGWIGESTQGAGVAVADISGSGRPDIVVIHVDAPGGGNGAYYRIGWDLDQEGDPSGGWTEPRAVPGWIGDETAGAGVAVADVSGNGVLDLVVFHVNHPGGGNRGYYRIGWNLGVDGNPTGGWTNPIAVPGTFGGNGAGAGIAAGDISGSGRADLVAFHVDSVVGENRGHYRLLVT